MVSLEGISAEDIIREACSRKFANYLNHVTTDEGTFPNWPVLRNFAAVLDSPYDILLLKRRQTLMSWVMGAYADWGGRMHDHYNVAVTSKGLNDSKEFLRKAKFIGASLPGYFYAGKYGVSVAEFARGGRIDAFPSTADAGLGRTLGDFIMDEAAFHQYLEANRTAALPALYKPKQRDIRRRGRLVMLSTANPRSGESGPFYAEWKKATRFMEPYWPEREPFADWIARQTTRILAVPVFMSRHCRPDQQGEEWQLEEMARMETEDEEEGGSAAFDSYYPETPEQAFAGREGLVFGRDKNDGTLIFDPARNVVKAPEKWGQALWRVVGIDPGGRDPAGIVGIGVFRRADGPAIPGMPAAHSLRHRHIFKALSLKGSVGIDDIVRILNQWHREGPITSIYVGETGGDTIVTSLQRRGWPAYMADKDRSQIAHLQAMFKGGRITVEDGEVARLFKGEVNRLYWQDDNKGGGPFDTYVKGRNQNHADVLDATRYAENGVMATLPSTQSLGSIQQLGRANEPQEDRRQRSTVPQLSQLGFTTRPTPSARDRHQSPWQRRR